MTPRFERVCIAMNDGVDQVVDCAARDGTLRVTRSPDGGDLWCVTHEPSGFDLGFRFDSIKGAGDAMRAINAAIDIPEMVRVRLTGEKQPEKAAELKRILRVNGGRPKTAYPPSRQEEETRLAELRRRLGWKGPA